MKKALNVFSGPDSLKKFLDPGYHPPIPLVELPERLNPLAKRRVRIFAKLMYLSPLLNSKALPTLKMLQEAAHRFKGVRTLVENSSGNTAFSLAILARTFGMNSVRALVPADIAPGKVEMLRLSGAEVRFVPGAANGIAIARHMAKSKTVLNLDQYSNPANITAHAQWTIKQIWDQTEGRISVFCSGLGTTGTLLGARRFFKRRSAKVALVGVCCAPGHAVPGVRSEDRLGEVGFDWRSQVEHLVPVSTKESYKASLDLCRAGILGGPSSGFALAGLNQFLGRSEELDRFRNRRGEVLAVCICPDTPFPYLDKYSTILDPEHFY